MDSQQQPVRYKEKSVIIHRDENGFGLRVGGQNPVFVDHVHENGAAWKAGVRKDDRIIKVNGTLVRSLDHQRVVHMIQNCTPFVNLTLHSSETIIADQSSGVISSSGGPQSNEPNAGGLLLGSNSSVSITINNSNNITNNNSNANDNSNLAQSNMKVHQRLHHHHSVPSNLAWLLDIGDDLFQDNQQKQPTQQQANVENISVSPNAHQSSIGGGGVSKLIVSGPSPTVTSHPQSNTSSGKPKMRHSRNQSDTRDNPYYYYKTAPERVPELTSCNSAINPLSLSGQDQAGSVGTSKSGPSLSIVRSRSSSKLSLTSTSGKYKPRNLRSRFVDDLRSLTITNSQATPSSLSTSPSSSDLSDCDDQDSNRIDCLSLNTTNCSASVASASSLATNPNTSGSTNPSSSSGSSCGIQKPKQTTRRFEIIRELVETEKAHTERLKHLNDLLYKPIKAEGLVPMEQLKMVFSCHKTLFKIHRQIYKILSTAQQNVSECHQEPLIGRALIEIFEGELGKRLEKAACTFCACQSTNTELLNRFTKKDTKVGEFLAQVANQQMLGRLGIKDLLASCFQRLTKYPLLLENLLKATQGATCGIHSKSLSEGYIITGLTASSSSIVNNVTMTTGGSANNNGTVNSNELPILIDKSTNNSLVTNNNVNVSSDVISNQTSNPSTITAQANASSAATPIPTNPTAPADINSSIAPTNSKTTSASATTKVDNTITSAAATTTTIEEDYAFERLCISRALNESRQILIHVNDAVKRAISHNKLRDIWRKTDKSTVLPVINIETEQMLHEGPLTLRLARRSFEVYVLLLTHYLVILTREGQEKYKLKCFNSDGKTTFSPIFNIDEHLATRDSATDENGFYLLCKHKEDSRIYEFASQSPTERASWKEKIHMAQTHNFATVPDDDNMLSRYRELITLATSSNTPNNIEHSPASNNSTSNPSQQATIAPPVSSTTVSAISTIQHQQASNSITCVPPPPNSSTAATTTTSIGTTVTTTGAQQINNSSLSHDLNNIRAQDV